VTNFLYRWSAGGRKRH